MYDILSVFIYWFNWNLLSFQDDMDIPQNSLFLQSFSWDLSLSPVLKE